ncbi:hypothetical protein Tco_0770343 [Tanacetum coccineum]|uniref:Uncharacterized protein n=1 Tax=Tanacetum coccineum TaxID=301880 RepID=A0ABQ4ZCZ2_9ASTR
MRKNYRELGKFEKLRSLNEWSFSEFSSSVQSESMKKDSPLSETLGIESYQIKIKLTAPTLINPDIENLELYYMITDPSVGIVYENSKKERRVMGIREIHVTPSKYRS